ncbi:MULTISPECIES: hypothetical protein [Agrobacterium]|uniref:Uncharacterized protein n=1 Tax=Agrobacterium tumefaciens TaxID=358 RepID=A0AAF0GVS5_AGRTU|nr:MULTISPECIES: hypothetical protein [Agrobacterium]WGM58272.1 hypothetical protein CFBP5506_07935 [Agrobacterium tumefaciens]CVI61527.1 conserved hypothetical protein [Agrobacterium salinitolerans str. Hayward 0363]
MSRLKNRYGHNAQQDFKLSLTMPAVPPAKPSILAVFALTQTGYDGHMNALVSNPLKFVLASLAVAASLAVVLLAFDGWVRHGTDIFLSTVQNGIAWCL